MKRTVIQPILHPFLVGLLLCAAGMFWPSFEDKRPFTVAVNIWPGMEAMLIAGQSSEVSKMRVNFVEMSWSAAAMGAFRMRVVDAAIVTLDELLLLEDEGAKPRAVLILGTSNGSDAILGRPGMKGIQDIRGKRVGVEMRSSGEHLLLRALSANGMSLQDVQVVALNQAETETAYDDKDIDVVVAADPWSIRLRDKGAAVLYDSTTTGLELSRVLVVREDALSDYSREIQMLISAHLNHVMKSGRIEVDSAGLDAVLRRENLTLSQWQRVVEKIHAPNLEENLRLMNPADGELAISLKQIAAVMRREHLLTHKTGGEPLLNSEFLSGSKP